MDFGKLHVVLVHFPIAFGLGAVAAEVIGLFVRRAFFRDAALYCLLAAANSCKGRTFSAVSSERICADARRVQKTRQDPRPQAANYYARRFIVCACTTRPLSLSGRERAG
jgi:hypothetical protein